MVAIWKKTNFNFHISNVWMLYPYFYTGTEILLSFLIIIDSTSVSTQRIKDPTANLIIIWWKTIPLRFNFIDYLPTTKIAYRKKTLYMNFIPKTALFSVKMYRSIIPERLKLQEMTNKTSPWELTLLLGRRNFLDNWW